MRLIVLLGLVLGLASRVLATEQEIRVWDSIYVYLTYSVAWYENWNDFVITCGPTNAPRKCTFVEFTKGTTKSSSSLFSLAQRNPNWDPLDPKFNNNINNAARDLLREQNLKLDKFVYENIFGPGWKQATIVKFHQQCSGILQRTGDPATASSRGSPGNLRDVAASSLMGVGEERKAINSKILQTSLIAALQKAVNTNVKGVTVYEFEDGTALGSTKYTYDAVRLSKDIEASSAIRQSKDKALRDVKGAADKALTVGPDQTGHMKTITAIQDECEKLGHGCFGI